MGTNAQVASLRKQVEAHKAGIEALQRRVDELIDALDRADQEIAARENEIALAHDIAERMMPVIEAALILTGLHPDRPMSDRLVDKPNNYMEVRLDHFGALGDAIGLFQQFMVKRVVPVKPKQEPVATH